jgi:ATP-dependent Lon protease
VLSAKNKRDIEEIEKHYLKGLTFHYVDSVDQVLKVALLKEKVKSPLIFSFTDQKVAVA